MCWYNRTWEEWKKERLRSLEQLYIHILLWRKKWSYYASRKLCLYTIDNHDNLVHSVRHQNRFKKYIHPSVLKIEELNIITNQSVQPRSNMKPIHALAILFAVPQEWVILISKYSKDFLQHNHSPGAEEQKIPSSAVGRNLQYHWISYKTRTAVWHHLRHFNFATFQCFSN